MFRKIEKCRICGSSSLILVLDLGDQMLTGVFPRTKASTVTIGPLRLVKCSGGSDSCGLLQLQHSYDPGEMYGENYGYRSGLNASMVEHLHGKVRRILGMVTLEPGDLVLDIGSNDSTTLQAYPATGPQLVGIDPTASKFSQHYPDHISYLPEFFSAALLNEHFGARKAKVITSFSMMYDLEDPTAFMRDIHASLADDGIWVFEQSYMPTMVEVNAYDTVCHEHVEYYALKQIKWMTDRVGFRIVDVEFNDVNGGSFSVTVSKSKAQPESPLVVEILQRECSEGYDTLEPFVAFAERVAGSRRELISFMDDAKAAGKSVAALGASTKGNVILQFCGLTEADIAFIGEVNSEKFGCFSPGSWIPIIPEVELLAKHPDYLLVMPWHFRSFFLKNARLKGANLVFPLPALEVVTIPGG